MYVAATASLNKENTDVFNLKYNYLHSDCNLKYELFSFTGIRSYFEYNSLGWIKTFNFNCLL